MIRRLICAWVFVLSAYSACAQHQQLWFDYQADFPYANQYLFEVTSSFQTLLTNKNKWRNYSLTPTFEYNLSNKFDLLANLPILFSDQLDTINSRELDPSLGVRFHVTQNQRINTRLIFKVEERLFQTHGESQWETSTRMRLKGEAWICINGPNLFTDKLWYAIIDYEEFIVTDQQLDERYANRRRGRLGLGYRLDYRHRFEFVYTRQSSRDEIQGGFIQGDNVIQLRYKMFFNASKLTGSKTTPLNENNLPYNENK